MQKLSSLQAARGLAALFVVAFHSSFINAKYVSADFAFPDFFTFGQTGVDLFFVISGFVMIVAFHNRFSERQQVTDFLKGRFLRIYPTYWVYFVILVTVYAIKPTLINSSASGKVDLVASFFLFPSETLPLLMVAWSLIHEIWFYLVFALFLMLPATWCVRAFALWFCAIVTTSLLLPTPTDPFLRIVAHPFSLEFIMGAFAGMAYLKARSRSQTTLISTAILLFIGVIGITYSIRTNVVDGSDVIASISLERAFVVGGSYTLILLAAALLERTEHLEMPRSLRIVGDMSYSLYLSHILTLSLVGRIWSAIGLSGPPLAGVIVFWVGAIIAVLAVAYLSYRYIERPILRFQHRTRHVLAVPYRG